MQRKTVTIRALSAAVTTAALACGALACAGAGDAQAAIPALSLMPFQVSPSLQKKLSDDYGEAELATLQDQLERSLQSAWGKSPPGACANGAVSVDTTLIDAAPNHPTRQQLMRQPSLDYLRSVSVGGAEMSGVLRSADGHVVATIPVRHFAMDIREARLSGDTWGDARQALDMYARALVRQCRGG
ncbi:MAG TPA: hypothetical protein VMI92_04380 [Steroidobacteraceae bacterium]|nr:hypothetical protein [Steroidobacteraceae bacterium]